MQSSSMAGRSADLGVSRHMLLVGSAASTFERFFPALRLLLAALVLIVLCSAEAVSAPPLTLSPTSGALPAGAIGHAYSQTIMATGGTPSYSFAITGGALPSGLTLASSGAVTGTPVLLGTVTFTVTATDAAAPSATGSATYTLSVTNVVPSIALSASPTQAAVGASISFTAVVSGGASPTGTVAFHDGGQSIGTAPLSGGVATFTIASLANGNHAMTAIYAGDGDNASVTSATVSVTVGVSAQPDPSQDAMTRAIVTSQAATSNRFAQAQIDNTAQHLEQLHGEPADFAAAGGRQGADAGDVGGDAIGRPSRRPGRQAGGGSDDVSPGLAYVAPDNVSPGEVASQGIGQVSQAFEAAERQAGLPFHLWSSGSVDWGRANGDGRFTSSGFTVGVDRQMSKTLTMGLSGGFGIDHSTFGAAGSASDGSAYTAQLYATVKLLPRTWFDLVGGYGALQFDSERLSDDGLLDGARDGHDLFGSVGLSTAGEVFGLRLTGYGRLDIVEVALDGYVESGPASSALAYDEMDTTTVAGVAGLKAAYAVPMRWGKLTPGGRIEYRHALDGGFTQSLGYADPGGFGSAISGDSTARDSASFGVSLGATMLDGVTVDLEYRVSADGDGISSQQVQAGVRLPF